MPRTGNVFQFPFKSRADAQGWIDRRVIRFQWKMGPQGFHKSGGTIHAVTDPAYKVDGGDEPLSKHSKILREDQTYKVALTV